MNNLILEIYTEEIPASYIDPALKQMSQNAAEMFKVLGIGHGEIKTYATPNRLAIFVNSLEPKSKDKEEQLLGPSLKAAKTPEGRFSPAAIGFASKCGVAAEKLQIKQTEKGEYLSFVKKTKGENTAIILQTLLSDLIKKISFPKSMVWEETQFRFARPVRAALALYGEEVIKFKIAGVECSNYTRGLHTTSNEKIIVKSADDYLDVLRKNNIIVDTLERRQLINKVVKEAALKVGSVIEDEELSGEVNYLVEYPTAVLCSFNERYLKLPDIVLIMCMKRKQKCFAITGKEGKLTNYFIGVRNGKGSEEIVKDGYQKVLAARLADAEFFYNNDMKRGLEANVEKLKGVVFNKEIGTVYEKVERIKKTAEIFNKEFGLNLDSALINRAVTLSKADLVTEMVFEYPELQGVMGKIYAGRLGETKEVADAIEQHYLPLSASGTLPESKLALLISLADKIDTLCANFAIGQEPTGSADPYGLRRAAIAVIRIMIEKFPLANFNKAVEETFNALPDKLKTGVKFATAAERLKNFFWNRIENMLEAEGYKPDEVKAVVNAAKIIKMIKALGTFLPKLKALKAARSGADFASVAAVFKRINNILSQAQKQNLQIAKVDAALFAASGEKELYSNYLTVEKNVNNYLEARDYESVFKEVLKLKPFIDAFFEQVMVMDENEKIKINRISLLAGISAVFAPFIDFSALQ
jgi:glycyl-tRNA synthetase beta chain